MASTISVRVAGRGVVAGGEKTVDATTRAVCDLCGKNDSVVVSTTPDAKSSFACRACLRRRLEATTIALWELKDPDVAGLPWGKISG